ncbi:MAG TPA: flagellar motor switch protein FliM [Actinobacteria bacterium]|nr:flagellar motor switch protein FliM [Actinomycetota bacterium]
MAGALTQDEINALLTGVTREEEGVTNVTSEGRLKQVRIYDFRHPDKFSKAHLNAIENIHQNLARKIGAALMIYLRQNISFVLASVEQTSFDDYVTTLSTPTTLVVFSLSPLSGNAVLDLSPTLTFMFYDRLLGGAGMVLEENRELTDIERSVVGGITQKILNVFQEAWAGIQQFDIKIEVIETNPQLVQIVPPNEIVINIVFEVRMGETTGTMSICLPYLTLEPVIPKLTRRAWFSTKSQRKSADEKEREKIEKNLNKVSLPVVVELGVAEISIGDLIDLKPGDAIQLDTHTDEEVKIKIGNSVKFYGKPGILGRKLAVKTVSVADERNEQ